MIEIYPLAAILTVEALFALLIWVGFLLVGRWNRGRARRGEATHLVERIQEAEPARRDDLAVACEQLGPAITDELRNATVEGVLLRERLLYRQIVKLFIEPSADALKQVEALIGDNAEPYWRLLRVMAEHSAAPAAPTDNTAAILQRAELARLAAENKSLEAQLIAARKALEDVSNEYAQMFGGAKPAEELRRSLRHVLDVFQEAEHAVRRSTPGGLDIPSIAVGQ